MQSRTEMVCRQVFKRGVSDIYRLVSSWGGTGRGRKKKKWCKSTLLFWSTRGPSPNYCAWRWGIPFGCLQRGAGTAAPLQSHRSSIAPDGVPGAPWGVLLCGFQCIACRICIKWQFGRNPCGMRLKINSQHFFHFIFSSIWFAPEYRTASWDLQFNSDTCICKRWLMNMRFQGRSLSVTWDLCRDSYYTSPLPACFRRNMNHPLKASCICKSAET